MQFTAVFIKKHILNGKLLLLPFMSLNDICCYIPAWFGVIASTLTGLITYECTIPTNTTRISPTKYLIVSDLLKTFKKRTRFGVMTMK